MPQHSSGGYGWGCIRNSIGLFFVFQVKGMETSPLSAYRCYYCALNGCFETVINHSFDIHTEEPLKCRQLVLDSSTGKFKYQTKQYDVLPSTLKQSRKYIACDSLNESIHIQASSDDCSPFRKRQKNDCTSRIRQNLFGSTLETELDIHTRNAEHSEEDTTNNSMDLSLASIEEEMSKLLPAVVHELSKVDKIDGLLSFMRLVKSGKFPLENIAFELFHDVVKWFSVENSSLMRYNKNTKDFWRLGYRLFHGRFIRFMSGFKHIGSIVTGRTERGNFNPQSSQVNFAVPDVSVIRSLSRAENVESIRPGILNTMLDKISINSAANTYKICFDGKKINSSVAEGGEIDLWGFETSPTLRDMKDKLERETLLVIKTKEALQELVQYNESITSLPLPLKCTVLNQLKSIIKVLSVNLKSLREKRLCAENGLSKFKKLGGTDWKTFKYLYVISYLTSRLYEIGECVNSLSKTIDSLGYICSVMNSCGHLYARAPEVNLGQQENFVCLSDVASESEEVQPCYIKQRCERWLEIRKTARATGSTLHAALGLNSLKTQLQHFDYVVNGLEKPSVDNQAKQRMQYGTDHEIDAVATLVSKVLPIFCPDVTYVEEGCYIEYNDNHTLLIVSPDGSGHKDIMGKTVLAFEFKCPFPGKVFTTPVHYSLPSYYILQVLSEMVVLRTDTLLYLCYSEETSTVLEVTFSEHLWSLVWQELVSVYGTKKPTRPMRKSSKLIEIRAEMEIFLKENVSLIAEVPSVRAKPCYHAARATPNFPYHFTHITNQQRVNVQPAMHNLIESLVSAEKGIQETYRLTKTRATEVLVFMLSDLDRIYKPEIPHSVPIAYGLQGRSLTTSVMRKMLRHVLSECAKRSLYVPVFSSDGQWYNLCVKDNADQPLTILQLQKSVWADVKKGKKTQILNELSEINIVHSDSAKFTETVDIQIENETLCIGRRPGNRVPILTSDHVKLLSINKSQDESNILECSATDDVDEIMSMIPSSIEDKMGNDFIEHLRNFVKSSMHNENTESDVNIDTAEVIENADEIPFSQIQDITNEFRSQLDQSGSQHISRVQSVITNDHVKQMLSDLQINAPLKWNSVTEQELLHKMSSAKLINQYFLRSDLIVCLKVVQAILKRNSIKCRVSWSKEQIVNLFSQQLGDKSVLQSSVRQIRRSPVKLKHLCRKSISKYPKHLLNIILSEHRFPECLEKWNENKPFQRTVKLASSNLPESWYSQPEYNLGTETYLFGVLDGHHLLTNAREVLFVRDAKS